MAATGTARRGVVAAYLLVVALIAGAAGLAFGRLDGELPHMAVPKMAVPKMAVPKIVEQAEAAEPTPAAPVADSLPLSVRPPPSGFRTLPADELAELSETSSEGLRLPRISSGGWMPWIANSRRFDPAGPPARIGLLVINLGVSEPAMRRAIEELPPEVSLAFLPGTPELPRWLRLARQFGHESYLMVPIEDPGVAERGIRPIAAGLDDAENLRRLRAAMARGEGYAGLVISSPGPAPQSESVMRPLVQEIADRGLALIEINPPAGTVQRLTDELGVGYARSTDVLDYKLAGDGVAGNLDRLAAWVSDGAPDRAPRHAFGVVQPDDEAIDAILGWRQREARPAAYSLVPIIGHFECRDACMARMRVQPAQFRP